jgi:hypothetical protein
VDNFGLWSVYAIIDFEAMFLALTIGLHLMLLVAVI